MFGRAYSNIQTKSSIISRYEKYIIKETILDKNIN